MRTIDLTKTFDRVPGAVVAPVAGSTPQSATVSTAFTNPLAVTVKDEWGNPLRNVIVHITAPASGAAATFSESAPVTDAQGVASVIATANATAGTYTVSAQVTGASVRGFLLTNTA
jgi:hypothetical protein